jgi:hypothetical protein
MCCGDVVGVCVEESEADMSSFGRCRMKRWLPRSLWLLAWSFWVWLGWGLYRELPRDLGPAVCQIPLENSWWIVGFLVDRHAIVARDLRPPTLPFRFAVFDAHDGARMHEFDNRAELHLHAPSRSQLSLKRGCERVDDHWVTPWKIPWEWQTVAIRDAYGRVVEREWAIQWNDHESSDGAFVADDKGTVYRHAAVNYRLLTLCQTILALPLVLLWAILRWRRKRKLRLASVQP